MNDPLNTVLKKFKNIVNIKKFSFFTYIIYKIIITLSHAGALKKILDMKLKHSGKFFRRKTIEKLFFRKKIYIDRVVARIFEGSPNF